MPESSLEETDLHAAVLSRGPPQLRSLPSQQMTQVASHQLSSALHERCFWHLAVPWFSCSCCLFWFLQFFRCVILPFCSEGQTRTCCVLSEVGIHDTNLWFLIQGILDLRCFGTHAVLAYCCLECSK